MDIITTLRIVATLQSQQINFWSNVQHTLERLAKEENVDLTIMDLNGDVTTFANVIDDIVAMMEGHTCGRRSTSCVRLPLPGGRS